MRIVQCLVTATLLFPLSATVAVPSFCASAKKGATKARVITTSEIVSMLNRTDKASNNKDVDAICAQLSPNLVARMTFEGQPTLILNFAQYKAAAAQGFAAVQNYKYRRTETRINIAPDGQSARVTATIREEMTISGRPLRGISKETAIYRIQGGRVLITSITAMSRIVANETSRAA